MSDPTLAERLLAELRQAPEPLPLTQVIQQSAPEADVAAIKKALADKKFKGQVQFSVKNKPDAPVALVENADKLFASDALLLWLLNALRGKSWWLPVDKLAAKVIDTGKARFLAAVEQRRQNNTWPAGVEVVQQDPLHLGLTAHKPPPPKETVLATQIVEAFRAHKAKGDNSYPLTLGKVLVELNSPPNTLIKKALRDLVFTSAVLHWSVRDAAPLVLLGDEQLLIESDALFAYVAGIVCTKKNPLATAEAIAEQWPQQRIAFLEALKQRQANNRVPPGFGILRSGDQVHFYSDTFPPARDGMLATKMHEELARRRERDPANYAISLRQLAETVEPNVDSTLLAKALKLLAKQVVTAIKGDLDAPAMLASDDVALAQSAPLLVALVEKVRTEDSHAVALADVKKKLNATLKGAFEDGLRARLQAGTVPDLIGTLKIKKVVYLFLRADINRPDKVAPQPAPSAPSAPLAAQETLEEAFDRLNAARGGVNQVSLVDLRAALPLDRAGFDGELHRLRVAGVLTLSQAEGQVSPEQQAAAIREENSLLLYVSRRL